MLSLEFCCFECDADILKPIAVAYALLAMACARKLQWVLMTSATPLIGHRCAALPNVEHPRLRRRCVWCSPGHSQTTGRTTLRTTWRPAPCPCQACRERRAAEACWQPWRVAARWDRAMQLAIQTAAVVVVVVVVVVVGQLWVAF